MSARALARARVVDRSVIEVDGGISFFLVWFHVNNKHVSVACIWSEWD